MQGLGCYSVALLSAVLWAICASAQMQVHTEGSAPSQFEIGRHTFIDVGPPNDFYELLLVRPSPSGASVEKVTLTPAGDACFQSASVELAQGTLDDPVATLLGKTDPCAIPEKELRRELKRCKKCLVFSGAIVAMRVQCGRKTRIIRADILDRDMFDRAPNTPKQTSWTMQLLDRLDRVVGPGVLDRPIFPLAGETEKPATTHDSGTLAEIAAGKYDALFPAATDKPSELYRASKIPPPTPTVRLLDSAPFQPEELVMPGYPPLARVAHVEGLVTFTVDVGSNGTATNLALVSGHPLFRETVKKATEGWRFPKEAVGQQIRATIQFATNCAAKLH
jgi:hypothetical protein